MLIDDWSLFIKSLLPTFLRGNRLVAFVRSLLSQSETAYTSTYAYIADARLRSAVTPQACWLQKILTDTLGYSVTITEANGTPVDFTVGGIHYADLNRASALLDQYKQAGRSYSVTISDITASAEWSTYHCVQTDQITASAAWSAYRCVTEIRSDSAAWSNYSCAKEIATLHVINGNGATVIGVTYNSSGVATNDDLPNGMQNIGAVDPYTLIAPETDITIYQSSATIDGDPEPANAYCTVTLLANNNSYQRTLNINVSTEGLTATRTWTFKITSGSQELEFTITQTL